MSRYCAAFGCNNNSKKEVCKQKKVSFHHFPLGKPECMLWLIKVRRKDFIPNEYSYLCSEHFTEDCFQYQPFTNRRGIKPGAIPTLFSYTKSRIESERHMNLGRPSKDPEHPDHVPNIFTFKPSKKTYQSKSGRKLCEVRTENIAKKTCIPEVFSSETLSTPSSIKIKEFSEKENETSKQDKEIKQDYTEISDLMHQEDELHMDLKFEEHSEVESEMSVQEKKLQQEYTQVCDLMHQENELHMKTHYDVSPKEELSSLKLELQKVYSTLHTVTQDRDQIKKELSSAIQTQNVLQNSLSDKEEVLSKVKKELQQAYSEINVLRREKEELQNKLSAADITQSILQDPKKLRFYTGLSSLKDFRLVLSLLSSDGINVRRISLETQTLIVLMKLKLNLWYSDLAHRFQCSHSTAQRICVTLIPILETKLDKLVKSPITAALKKNIPVGFKNTVYENLYLRVQKNFKMRTKEEEDSISIDSSNM